MSDAPLLASTPLPHSDAPPARDAGDRPTWVRYRVLAFLAAMTFVLYLDRVCIAQAAPDIQRELGISETGWGFVIPAFTLSYAFFEVPAGRWGEPEELVGAAVFLGSRASDFINGQIIYVDGGILAAL